MEAQGGAEVRRLHIIYFLSRKGRIEHPHLIRVHHLCINGIRLRDVKRWLAELRGKDMPESFAWSYKRRYKTGYVWQDLLDEDLITPISDNEYVLKGYEICSFTSNKDYTYGEKKVPMQKKPSFEEAKEKSKEENQEHINTPMVLSKKSSSEIEEESPLSGSETSTATHDRMKLEEEKHLSKTEEEIHDKVRNSSPLYTTLLNKKTKKKNTNNVTMEKTSSPSSTTPPLDSSSNSSRSCSNGASQIFRNLITCGAVDINDSAMVSINRRNKPSLNASCSKKANHHMAEISKREKLGGSRRVFGTPSNQPQQNGARKSYEGVTDSTKFCSPRTSSAAHMPVNGPICSQCGKQFKPEKLHKHMKYCKGMKAIAKRTNPAIFSNAVEKTSQSSTESSRE